MPSAKTLLAALLAAAALLGAAAAGRAGSDHDDARRLREAGAILPLEQILAAARARHPGRVLETGLEHERDRYVYEIKLADEHGVVWELEYDARSAELLREKKER